MYNTKIYSILFLLFLFSCNNTEIKTNRVEIDTGKFKEEHEIINRTLGLLVNPEEGEKKKANLYIVDGFICVYCIAGLNNDHYIEDNVINNVESIKHKKLLRKVLKMNATGSITLSRIKPVPNFDLKKVDDNLTIVSGNKNNIEVLEGDRIVEFSQMAFNEEHNSACFYVKLNCIDEGEKCTYSKFIFVDKIDGKWLIVNEFIEWMGK